MYITNIIALRLDINVIGVKQFVELLFYIREDQVWVSGCNGWYDHVLKKDGEDTSKRMLTKQMQGKKTRERPEKRWLENIREYMKEYNTTEEMAEHRIVCHVKIYVGPLRYGGGL